MNVEHHHGLSAMRLDVAAESERFFAKEVFHSGMRWGYTPLQKVSASRTVSPGIRSDTNFSLQGWRSFMVIELEREQTQSAEPIQVYLREIGRVPLLTLQQESDLAKRIKRGDQKARAHMIKANLRLVVKIAHDYDGLGLPLLDLISEGNIGLMKAVERFEPTKGAKLSTYASWWIKQAMRRALSNQSRTIRLPVHVVDKVSRLKRLSHSLADQLGREPTNAELANRCNVPASKVSQLRTLDMRPTSLDAPIGDDNDNRFSDIIEDEAALTPHELLRMKAMGEEIRQHIKHLTPREAEILTMRFGIDGRGSRTLDTVGKKFKVTRERIRQIQDMALTKLRRRLEKLDRRGWETDHGN
jgi:RNA polymerase primary sigma factor